MMAVCLLTLLCVSSAKSQTLVLLHANGTTTDVQLHTQMQVKLQNDKVIISSSMLNLEYPKADVLRFTYKGSSTYVTEPSAKAEMSQQGDQLVFHGVNTNDKVSVYTTNGIRVPVSVKYQANTATLPLSAIPSGDYLLNVNGQISKFTKQ